MASGAALATAACDSDGAKGSPAVDSNSYQLLANFPQSVQYAAVGAPQRLPFLIAKRDDAPLDSIAGAVTFTVSKDGKAVGKPISVTARSTDIPRAYLALELTFPAAGIYDLAATYRGSKLTSTIQAFDAGQVTLPQVGAKLPSVATPTTTDARGVTPICTNEPPCQLHTLNLVDSLAAGRPVAMLLSTPRFCQTAICGPVLDLLVTASKRTDIDFIHVEPYSNPLAVESIAEASLSPLAEAYTMPFEPCLFVVNTSGTLVRRLDSIYDRTELEDALAAALA